MRAMLVLLSAVSLLLAGAPGAASAAPAAPAATVVPDIPQVQGPVPVTPDSGPWGRAAIPGVRGSVDLESYGYVEEEFFVSGRANVYQYDEAGRVKVKTAGVPYTSRILVRRPEKTTKFSGNVVVETNHPQYGFNTMGSALGERLPRTGDAYVSITTRRTSGPAEAPSAVEVLSKLFDSDRYESLNFPEDGLNWDLILQVGRLLKSTAPHNPLAGYRVERLYLTGFSGGGAITQFILNDFHTLARTPAGGPIYDGYLLGEPSGYPPINSSAPALPGSDPRHRAVPTDVPVIELHTRHTPTTPDDSDDPHGLFRNFEVAGLTHTATPVTGGPSGYQLVEVAGYPVDFARPCTIPNYDILIGDTIALSLHYLDSWSRRGVAPPHAPDLTADRDVHGNQVGGIRSPYLDVPIATYPGTGHPDCPDSGARVPFDDELQPELYPTKGAYVSQFIARTNELVREGWLLPDDARRIRQEATHSDIGR